MLSRLCLCLILVLALYNKTFAQFSDFANKASNFGSGLSKTTASLDSFQARDYSLDSMQIVYTLLSNHLLPKKMDSTFPDIYSRLNFNTQGVPINNDGSPILQHVYQPLSTIGWNKGPQLFDHLLTPEDSIKFFRSMFPFSQVSYSFGSNETQGISFLYSQNINSRLNFGGAFRSYSSPGFFKNQNTYHFSAHAYMQFETLNKAYKFTALYIEDNAQAATNGGVVNPDSIRDGSQKALYDRTLYPVWLGNNTTFSTNIFSNTLSLGNKQSSRTFLFANRLSFGSSQKLTIINKPDSAKKNLDSLQNKYASISSSLPPNNLPQKNLDTLYRFYKIPAFTIEYTFKNKEIKTNFIDKYFTSDSAYYKTFTPNIYKALTKKKASILDLGETWNNHFHTLNFTHYPQSQDLEHFLSAQVDYILTNQQGVLFQDSTPSNTTNHNLQLSLHYQRTFFNHNRLSLKAQWYQFDITNRHQNKFNTNLSFSAQYQHVLKNNAFAQMTALYTESAPSFVANKNSVFYLDPLLFEYPNQKSVLFKLAFHSPSSSISILNHTIQNFLYYQNFETPSLAPDLINIFQIFASHHLVWKKKWHLEVDMCYQPNTNLITQKPLDQYLPLPQLWIRSRWYFQKQLHPLSFIQIGSYLIYNSPYKAPYYSPLVGKFVVQQNAQVFNYPTLHLFLNLKIRNFSLYWIIENLNTIAFKQGSLYYTNNNFSTPNMPTNELAYKCAIWWNWLN